MVSSEKSSRSQETAIVRFFDGKIVECWRTIDEHL
jgi:hypothetical protein